VACIHCYQNHLQCDNRRTCFHCYDNNSQCRRTACADYATGTCDRKHCTRAHEEDERRFSSIVNTEHFSRAVKSPRKSRKR
ncbi:hypothetical protein K491DRAFT_572012, partial [Lophiostoma macrostomum CBS 122681]